VGRERPRAEDLDEEIERLLYIRTAEQPDHVVKSEELDPLINLDSDILTIWFMKKFKPALIQRLICSKENYYLAKRELFQMPNYQALVERFLRAGFLEKRAAKMVQEFHFASIEVPSLEHVSDDLKKLLTMISEHLKENSSQNLSLLNTDAYTPADVTLYNFLKRIIVGKYKDEQKLGLHVRLLEPLMEYMHRYAQKNTHIIDISRGDPMADTNEEPNLMADIVKSATIGFGVILFFIWAHRS